MKKYTIKLLALLLLVLSIFSTFAVSAKESKTVSWYVKRRGDLCPDFPMSISEMKKYNSYCIDDNLKDGEKKIYLTFDSGYANSNLEKILDVLKDEGVPAAFFLLDYIILKNTDLVIRMADEGHTVCNHTKKHKDLSCASISEIGEDLSALEEIYYEKTGRVMSKYFRFPEGKYSIDALSHVSKLGYKTIFWSFGYEDWNNSKQPSKDYAKRKILSNTHNGAVFLFHPTSKTNADIFSDLIKEWRKMGYSFGTLDELCGEKA